MEVHANTKHPPSVRDIIAARKRIEGVATTTPLVRSPALTKRLGIEVYLKMECFQPIRVFKIRGAFNRISQASEKQVVAVSSGNHGLAVAYSCWKLGKRCTVVVPETAVKEKIDMIAEFEAEVVRFGRYQMEREARGLEIARQTGAAFVHPFDDAQVVAGQGTCGLEIVEQLPEEIESVIVPVGGGGLISGVATALKGLKPDVRVFGVEPEGAPKLQAALARGGPVKIEAPFSIADGLVPQSVSDLTFQTCSRYVDGIFGVSDDQIIEACRLLVKDAHVFPEPSGAAGLAPLLDPKNSKWMGKRVVIVVSGGNVSLKFLTQILEPRTARNG